MLKEKTITSKKQARFKIGEELEEEEEAEGTQNGEQKFCLRKRHSWAWNANGYKIDKESVWNSKEEIDENFVKCACERVTALYIVQWTLTVTNNESS